jgi:RNA polymerase sigma factor (sigma-70 family)
MSNDLTGDPGPKDDRGQGDHSPDFAGKKPDLPSRPFEEAWVASGLGKRYENERIFLFAAAKMFGFLLWRRGVTDKDLHAYFVQACMLKLFRAIIRGNFEYRSPGQLWRYLDNIVTSALRDYYRKPMNKREKSNQSGSAEEDSAGALQPGTEPIFQSPAVWKLKIHQEQAEHVNEVLETLSQEDESVLRLRYWQDRTFAEIDEAMKCKCKRPRQHGGERLEKAERAFNIAWGKRFPEFDGQIADIDPERIPAQSSRTKKRQD